jgi:Flp pilus assembly protein TadG
MNKRGIIWLVVILLIIAFCGAFYLYQIHGSTTSMTEIVDINTTASASKNQTTQNKTTNQSVFSVPLEKPPFID